MFFILVLTTLISTILIVLNSAIGWKPSNEQEKISPFECGFNPQYFSRAPFSMQFFLIAIIFLIFDVEITLLLPIPIIFMTKVSQAWLLVSILFALILLIGLYHEWNHGALFWPK